LRIGLAALCAVLLLPGDASLWAGAPAPRSAAQDQESKLPPDQLDSLVAPIALYPDPLLVQVLAAATYPLELMQLQQWLGQNKGLKDQALADAVQKQDWDPSIQGLAGLPDVVKRLADDIKWTTDLGNAFLSQQSDVMDAVQRMRAKAQEKGNLKSNEQMKVETKTVESKHVIVIEQANPQVVYVPSYEPTVVYGPPVYPYPPIYYPPPGYYAAGMALSFGVGVAMGAMWSGGWGYGAGWGGNNNININNNNNFNRNSNVSGGNRNNIGNSNWSHNASHRGGTPYSNKSTADRFGGTTRGSSQGARQASARQQVGRGQASGNFGGATGGRGGGASAGTMDRGAGGRGGGASGNPAGAGGGADRVGNRSTSGSRGSSSNAFGGGGGNSSGSGARASSSRGSSSMGGSRGGGGRGGGGGRRR
jgi:hypothetical protein